MPPHPECVCHVPRRAALVVGAARYPARYPLGHNKLKLLVQLDYKQTASASRRLLLAHGRVTVYQEGEA